MSRIAKVRKLRKVAGEAHPDHAKELHRLSRIQGQLSGIGKMIEGRRYCPDILMQTRAVKAAIQSLETSILEKHLEHCVHEAFNANHQSEVKAKIKELLGLFRKNG